jgi:hypothetical protein
MRILEIQLELLPVRLRFTARVKDVQRAVRFVIQS